MIHVVGGAYLEKCLEPSWNKLFGSGGRAAGALTRLEEEVHLSTYIDKKNESNLKLVSDTLNFTATATLIDNTLCFNYRHCLSEPAIQPDLSSIEQQKPLLVNDVNIIRYGFLEGDAIVHGEKVVYDPQNDYKSKSFRVNGSTADSLAIIANTNECRKMTESDCDSMDPEVLGKTLLELEKAEVVVVKQGSLGALVVTKEKAQSIPVYRTNRVFSIGSGDIFTAVFAHYWFSGKTPFESADLASKATAFYCNTPYLPIRPNFEELMDFYAIENKNNFPRKAKQIYLAGPFFNIAERWLIEESLIHLRDAGFKVFSPLHDVGIGPAEKVAVKDIEGLKQSDLIFAILNNFDAGTVYEVGYARSLSKPVIALVENPDAHNLTMFKGDGCEIVNEFVAAIYRAVWTAMQI